MGIQRYRQPGCCGGVGMIGDPAGKWVRYASLTSRQGQNDKRIAALTQDNERLSELLDLHLALVLCEHKIDQHLQGQYPGGEALVSALKNARAALALDVQKGTNDR